MAAGFVNSGLNHVLNTEWNTGTQVAQGAWYLGLINNSPSPTFAATDTAAQIGGSNGWSETTAYSGGRKVWTNGAASSQQITNGSVVVFGMTGSVTVYGVFLGSGSSGTSGTLACTAAFSGGVQAVGNGDSLQVTLTISAASG